MKKRESAAKRTLSNQRRQNRVDDVASLGGGSGVVGEEREGRNLEGIFCIWGDGGKGRRYISDKRLGRALM